MCVCVFVCVCVCACVCARVCVLGALEALLLVCCLAYCVSDAISSPPSRAYPSLRLFLPDVLPRCVLVHGSVGLPACLSVQACSPHYCTPHLFFCCCCCSSRKHTQTCTHRCVFLLACREMLPYRGQHNLEWLVGTVREYLPDRVRCCCLHNATITCVRACVRE